MRSNLRGMDSSRPQDEPMADGMDDPRLLWHELLPILDNDAERHDARGCLRFRLPGMNTPIRGLSELPATRATRADWQQVETRTGVSSGSARNQPDRSHLKAVDHAARSRIYRQE